MCDVNMKEQNLILREALQKIAEKDFSCMSEIDLANYLFSVGVKTPAEFLQLIARNALADLAENT